jgi:cytidylate kinase
MTWLEDCIQSFSAGTDISENTYVRYLVELLFSLSAMGESIVVGRGGAQILPPETTLRVRLIAPRNHRIATVAQFSDMSQSEATKWVDTTDQNRHNFVLSHFSKNPTDALNYDLIINTCRLSEETVAEVIVQALYQLKAQRSVSAAVS